LGLLPPLLKADQAGDTLYSPWRGETPHNCDIYLAPAPPRGWGVYAARDFEKNDVIEVSPRFIIQTTERLRESVLDDYYYGWRWESNPDDSSTFGVLVFGESCRLMDSVFGGSRRLYSCFLPNSI